MKIALIGATGFVGSAILKEALDRKHFVTAISRNPNQTKISHENLSLVKGDVFSTRDLAQQLKGHDIVISAYNPGWTNPNIYNDFLKGAQSIQEAIKQSGVKRFLIVGGAGSLYVAPGKQLIDTDAFPAEYKAGAEAARQYLDILRKEQDLEWTFLSPAIEMHQGTSGVRKGHYRLGEEHPVFDENNRSIISAEDMAIAILDEAENQKFIRKRFTVAY